MILVIACISAGAIAQNSETAATSPNFRAYNVQNLEGAELFEAIIGKEKGKVVVIDFWGVNCGPCLNAHNQFKPHKSQFDPDKVTFVYIVNQSSSMQTWENMIPEISGEHYRLTTRQFNYMLQRLGVRMRGIPLYIILDKNGNTAYSRTGFPGVGTIVGKINEALEK